MLIISSALVLSPCLDTEEMFGFNDADEDATGDEGAVGGTGGPLPDRSDKYLWMELIFQSFISTASTCLT